MSRQPIEWYAIFSIAQLSVLIGAYFALRLKTRMKVLMSVCLSILATALLTVLTLCSGINFIGVVDRREYAAGTLVVASPFILILLIKFLIHIAKLFGPLLRENISGQKPAGPERARIVKMMEEGKITAEEGVELLDAMGRSNALQGQDKFSRLDIAMLCAVALVVFGFFMPWAYVNMRGLSDLPGVFGKTTIYQAGYQAGALGWAVFIIALLSAAPVFFTPKDFLYKVSMLQVFLTLMGLVLTVSILIRVGGQFGAGLIVCLAGFAAGLYVSAAKFKGLAA